MSNRLKPYFWLALLAHLLLFLSFSLSYLYEPEEEAFEKKSDKYLPAYLYQKENHSPQESQSAEPSQASQQAAAAAEKPAPESIALKKQESAPKQQQQEKAEQTPSIEKPKALASSAFIQAESPNAGKPNDEPLLKELSRATAAKLFYPNEAAAFRLTGTVTVSFLLYPDGRVTNVTLAKSSGFRILDEAALATIRAISPVRDANLYVTTPRTLLAGIIFG